MIAEPPVTVCDQLIVTLLPVSVVVTAVGASGLYAARTVITCELVL